MDCFGLVLRHFASKLVKTRGFIILIEDLLHWPVKNRNLLKLGRRIEEINREIQKLDNSLASGVPNRHRANSLNQKIRDRYEKARRLRPGNPFERLVLKNFIDTLWSHSEYLKFVFTKGYSRKYGVRQFINYTFYPESAWPDPEGEWSEEKNGAVLFIEGLLKTGIDYQGITKREDLMWEVELYRIPPYYEHVEYEIKEEIQRIKRLVRQFNLDRGFITLDQAEALEDYERKRDLDRVMRRFQHLFGPYLKEVYEKLALLLKDSSKDIVEGRVELDKDTKELIIDINPNDEEFACFDPNTGLMELNRDRFYFYLDKKAEKIRFYAGDLYPTVWHENIHRLQKFLSRKMPPGLRQTDGELNLASRVVEEGVAGISEDFFEEYMEDHKRSLGLSKKDIERAKYEDSVYMAKKIIRFCHAMYHWEVNVESELGKRGDYEAHMRLVEKSGNWALADVNYLNDDHFADAIEELFYIFGRKYVNETMQELEKTETARLGSRRKARKFIRDNQDTVLQGLMTGSWGWSTHKEFFLKHYWPKARRYCD